MLSYTFNDSTYSDAVLNHAMREAINNSTAIIKHTATITLDDGNIPNASYIVDERGLYNNGISFVSSVSEVGGFPFGSANIGSMSLRLRSIYLTDRNTSLVSPNIGKAMRFSEPQADGIFTYPRSDNEMWIKTDALEETLCSSLDPNIFYSANITTRTFIKFAYNGNDYVATFNRNRYTVYSACRNDGIIELTAYDLMYKFNQGYVPNPTYDSWYYTPIDMIMEVCEQAGVNFFFPSADVPFEQPHISGNFEEGTPLRNILVSMLCNLGAVAAITFDGFLQLKYITNPYEDDYVVYDDAITSQYSLRISDTISVAGYSIVNQEGNAYFDILDMLETPDPYVVRIQVDTEWFKYAEEGTGYYRQVINPRIAGSSYMLADVSAVENPLLEAGDMYEITENVYNADGTMDTVTHTIIASEVVYSYHNATMVASYGQGNIENKYGTNSSAQVITTSTMNLVNQTIAEIGNTIDQKIAANNVAKDAEYNGKFASNTVQNITVSTVSLVASSGSQTQTFGVSKAGMYHVVIQRYGNNSATSGRVTMVLNGDKSVTANYNTMRAGGCILLDCYAHLNVSGNTIVYSNSMNAALSLTNDAKYNFIQCQLIKAD